LIYSCSGCSNLAQLANQVAVTLDRRGEAEMSCIAGVGGDVPALVRVATSGRPIVVVDGCALTCARSALARHGVTPLVHHVLSEWGLAKRQHEDFTPEQAAEAVARVRRALPRAATPPRPGGGAGLATSSITIR
jgi:uncharacterized metal-binding protein